MILTPLIHIWLLCMKDRPIPIVHRVIKVHERQESGEVDILTKGDNNLGDDRVLYAHGQRWLQQQHIMGRAVGFLPYVGWVTIVMTEQPIVKYLLIGALGLLVITSKDWRWLCHILLVWPCSANVTKDKRCLLFLQRMNSSPETVHAKMDNLIITHTLVCTLLICPTLWNWHVGPDPTCQWHMLKLFKFLFPGGPENSNNFPEIVSLMYLFFPTAPKP